MTTYTCYGEKAKSEGNAGKKSKASELKDYEYRIARPKMRKKDLKMPTRDEYYAELEKEARIHAKGGKD